MKMTPTNRTPKTPNIKTTPTKRTDKTPKKGKGKPPPFTDKGLYEATHAPAGEINEWGLSKHPCELANELEATFPLVAAYRKAWNAIAGKGNAPESLKSEYRKARNRLKKDALQSELEAALTDFWHAAESDGDAAAFRAGWKLRQALDLAGAFYNARRGKQMNVKKAAARPRPKRKTNPLKVAVLQAWEDYREDTEGTGTKLNFGENWLFAEGDAYDIEGSHADAEFSHKGHRAKMATVRRWLK